jgi:hypothetical protein
MSLFYMWTNYSELMSGAELSYFVHSVDGERYGAWYRVRSSDQLEVIGVGMLETTEFAGFDPEGTARSVLENFVRQQRSLGIPMPSVASETPETQGVIENEESSLLHSRPDHQDRSAPRVSAR